MPLPTLHTAAIPTIGVDLLGNPIDPATSTRLVQGNIASGATDSGNPVKVGGRFNSIPPTLANGQRADLQLSNRGLLLTQLGDGDKVAAINYGSTDAVPFGTIPGLLTVSQNYLWNGANYDRQRGDVTGAWSHAPANTVSTALSGTIATSGTTAAITFVNTVRQDVVNPSTSTLWASWGTPAVNGPGSFPIAAGESFSTDRTAGTLTVLSTVAAQPFTVNRYA